MQKTRLNINVGVVDHDVPTVEGCLKDGDGRFDSIQNAVRIHEWLRGTSLTPPFIEATGLIQPGMCYETKILGNPNISAYAERWFPGQLLELEKILIALPTISEVMNDSIAQAQSTNHPQVAEACGETTSALMRKVGPVWAFNASSMYFGHDIPVRFFFQTLDTLHILITCVLTQRDKVIFSTEDIWHADLPIELYNVAELDKVVARIHNAELEGFFPHPANQAKADGLIDETFYKQCAMAISSECNIPIPRDYVMDECHRAYHWAKKILNSIKVEIPAMRVRPKLQNVVKLFRQ